MSPAQATMLQQIGRELASDCEGNFVALYLVGSFGTERQIRTSDVDLVLVTQEPLDEAGRVRLMNITAALRSQYNERIGVLPRTIAELLTRGMGVKHDGRLIAGRDLRDEIRELSPDEYAALLRNAAIMFLKRIHAAETIASEVLRYPDEQDAYCGYVDRDSDLPLHRLMSLTFLAHARVATEHRVFARNKHVLPELYARHIHDGTERFVHALFDDVRRRWGYALPVDPLEQPQLQELCRSALEFEKRALIALGM